MTHINKGGRTVNPVLNDHSKTKIGFQDQLSLMQVKVLQNAHSAILSTNIKLPFDIKIFVLSTFSGHLRQVLLYRLHYAISIWILVFKTSCR